MPVSKTPAAAECAGYRGTRQVLATIGRENLRKEKILHRPWVVNYPGIRYAVMVPHLDPLCMTQQLAPRYLK